MPADVAITPQSPQESAQSDQTVVSVAAGDVTDLAAVREADVAGFVAALRSGPVPLAASSAARALAAVRGLHRFAVRDLDRLSVAAPR